MIVTPCFTTFSPANAAFDVAARVGREVDDHATRPHRRQLRIADQARRRPARDQSGGDDEVLLGDVAGHQLGLRLLIFVRHFGRVAARALALDTGDILDEDRLGAERLDLFLGRRADVGRADLRPRRRAVAIAWSPATPTPMTKTRAALTVPAAVIIIGKARP